ncbi:MAG: hypothetical protein ACTSYQ_04400 [Candidatus Odinarchaeia archaeon]
MSLSIKLLFDQTHNEGGRLDSTYSELKAYLSENQLECYPLNDFPITLNKIKKYDIFIIAGPDMSKFRDSEIQDIIEYVSQGGKLILMSDAGGDKGHMTNLNKISTVFGVEFNANQVIDSKVNRGIETVPVISNIKKHKITDGVSSISYRTGCSLKVKGDAEILIRSNQTSEPPNAPLMAVSYYKKGVVICLGTYELFRNKGLGGFKTLEHKKLFINICDYILMYPDIESVKQKRDVSAKTEIKQTPLVQELKSLREENLKKEYPRKRIIDVESVQIKPVVKGTTYKKLASKIEELQTNVEEILSSIKEQLYSNSELHEQLGRISSEIKKNIKLIGESGIEKIPSLVNKINTQFENIKQIISLNNKNITEVKSTNKETESLLIKIKRNLELLPEIDNKLGNIKNELVEYVDKKFLEFKVDLENYVNKLGKVFENKLFEIKNSINDVFKSNFEVLLKELKKLKSEIKPKRKTTTRKKVTKK